ncbi:GNAT family N-acetyltransferase [Pseudoprimorskyibacter insulae]|uniref:Acetyltransferase n=1 Tax=Pseudoprimorskyibacter insulae TaxID=1695997 RepID=A0A2R8AUD1_9RHOB|nr:GNAT family N-acetyltransferase [Pseudoprimorskyibacter insulae]SPF79636.1 Acetyltransferase [Pseudoprimorskyibacter insulae]
MTWQIRETSDLTDAHALRRTVFIEEQAIAEAEEWDDLDDQAIHLVAYQGETPLGTARLLTSGSTGKIGRICVAKPARGTGLGAALVAEGIQRLAQIPGLTTVRLSAQVYATGFYEKLGFSVISDQYDDAGIPHHDMERPL